MPMTGFICQDSYLAKMAKLSDQEVGRLFRALMKYHATGEDEELTGRESIAYDFIKDDIDRAEMSYARKCEQARTNRNSGKRTMTDDNGREQPLTDVDGCQPEQTDDDGGAYNKIKIKENKIKDKGVRETQKRFTPPTLDEVTAYCRERGNKVTPERFIDFYSSKGWKVGNQPMKDWKAAVRTWEQRDNNQSSPQTRKVVAQQYEQRDYSETEPTMEEVLKTLQQNGLLGA